MLKERFNVNKLHLLAKPCQSGKTGIMINHLKDIMINTENNNKNIAILFCNNSLLETSQSSCRIENNDIENVIISSKSNTKNIHSLLSKILTEDIRTIICCANSTQINNIKLLLKKISKIKENYSEIRKHKFHIFIDEADKTFGGNNFTHIKEFTSNELIEKITLITATPKRILNNIPKNEGINIISIEESYNRDVYHRLEDSEIIYIEDENDNYYYENILSKYFFQNNTFMFCPGSIQIKSHNKMRKILNDNGFNVLVINSEGNIIYYKNGIKKDIPKKKMYNKESSKIELSKWLSNIYNDPKFKLKGNKFAITGHLSIGRGITISSPKLMLTHAILPPKSLDSSNLYQLCGRCCGNIKKWTNYEKIIIFSKKNVINEAILYQNKVIKLVEDSKKLDRSKVNITNYLSACCIDDKYGIPAKITFKSENIFKKFLKLLKKYKGNKLDETGRLKIKELFCKNLKKMNLSLYDFSFETCKIKNIKLINCKDRIKTMKYPLLAINERHKFKEKYPAEKGNCTEPGDAIMYILVNDFDKFSNEGITKGTIFITYIKCDKEKIDL